MLLKNKKILITGLANKYSIASGIAAAMHREGAELAFTYQNERLLKNLKPPTNLELFGTNSAFTTGELNTAELTWRIFQANRSVSNDLLPAEETSQKLWVLNALQNSNRGMSRSGIALSAVDEVMRIVKTMVPGAESERFIALFTLLDRMGSDVQHRAHRQRGRRRGLGPPHHARRGSRRDAPAHGVQVEGCAAGHGL